MKLKNLSKLMPLCLLACLTSCDTVMTTSEIKFIDENVKITLSEDKLGYVKKVKRILNELEQYADPSNVTRLLNEKYDESYPRSSRKRFSITDDYMLFELIYKTHLDYENSNNYGFFSYDNGYKAMIKRIINEGRSPYSGDADEQNELNSLLNELRNADFSTPDVRYNSNQWYGQVEYTSSNDFTFDFRPVIEGYALEIINSYLGNYYKRCKEYTIKMSPNSMYVLNKNAKDFTFEGPYGKPLTIKNISKAYISVASAVDSKVVIDDQTYSTKFIDLHGAGIENDAAIVVTVEPEGNYGMTTGIEVPKRAFLRMKDSYHNYSYDEGYGVYTILFKNEEIVYCSKNLDVKYGGASYGKYQSVAYQG